MFVIGNFIGAVASLINFILGAYMWVIVGRAIISWVNPDPYNPIVRFLYDITEPLLNRIRRLLPFSSAAGIDFSPMILILIILFLQSFIVPTLHGIARSLG
ncbi:MAG: YggT family protein [Deltaproteobacteria bacterium]|nr:YggT family protein [Deltaproteobacteria bacterium]